MRYAAAYLRFEVLRALRNRRYIIVTVVLPAAVYLMVGRQHASRIHGLSLPWPTYFAVSMISFAATLGALNAGGARLAMERKSGWTRQIRITSLSSGGFVTAKVLMALCVAIPGSLLVGVAGAVSGQLHLSVATWVELYASVWFAALPFATLGMVIGFAFDVDTAQIGTGLTFAVLAILGGLFAPVTSFPRLLQDVAKAMPTYEMANNGRAVLAGNLPRLVDVLGLVAWTAVPALVLGWLYRRDEESSAQ